MLRPPMSTVKLFVFMTSSAARTPSASGLLRESSEMALSPPFLATRRIATRRIVSFMPARDGRELVPACNILLPTSLFTFIGKAESATIAACSTISTVPLGMGDVATTPLPLPGRSRTTNGGMGISVFISRLGWNVGSKMDSRCWSGLPASATSLELSPLVADMVIRLTPTRPKSAWVCTQYLVSGGQYG